MQSRMKSLRLFRECYHLSLMKFNVLSLQSNLLLNSYYSLTIRLFFPFFRHSKMTFQPTQINWLVKSSSLLNRLASILEADPDTLLKSTAGRRVSKRVQERVRDRLVGLIRRAAENSLVLLSEV
jgi:hypothetical protein